jgi:DNA mismatch repair protein MutL
MMLPPHEARRIAAGEVIDRPAALVREFIDNAIDAGADNIEVSIEDGGCKKIEVADDGDGMDCEDLAICYLDHATSKIRGLDDLDTAVTLGFRGEALAAAAAVSRLEIISKSIGKEAWRLETRPEENYPSRLEQTRRTKGTTARAFGLFESTPARKKFLKREGSEGMLCHQAFIDKALAFPDINFRFTQDGKLKDFLPAVQSKKERFAAALLQAKAGEENFLHEINVTGEGFNATVVIGSPDICRNDKRHLFVFANGRKVQDYSLIQAMEYGTQGWFPNGTHPVGAVFVEIDPALADFNIHPAKLEVRFRNPGAIHQAVSVALRNFFHLNAVKNITHKDIPITLSDTEQETHREEEFQFTHNAPASESQIFDSEQIRQKFSEINFTNEKPPAYDEMKYAGRAFGLFILIEWKDKLYLIDQHAAHERILYNSFLEKPIPKQELLAPIPFSTESSDEDNFLEKKCEELSRLGIDIKKDKDSWRIEALPADWRMGDAQTVKEILELRSAGENMAERWAATLCCHAAIKDGDIPDDETVFNIGREALELPDPRCPHGRPIWTEISKDALYKAVRRST